MLHTWDMINKNNVSTGRPERQLRNPGVQDDIVITDLK
jgi:hypothetical protein